MWMSDRTSKVCTESYIKTVSDHWHFGVTDQEELAGVAARHDVSGEKAGSLVFWDDTIQKCIHDPEDAVA